MSKTKTVYFSEQYVDEAVEAIKCFATGRTPSSFARYQLREEQRTAVREACEMFLASPAAQPSTPFYDVIEEHSQHCGKRHRTKDAFVDCNRRHARHVEREYQQANPE